MATLVSDPGAPALDEAALAGVCGKLRGSEPCWLAPGVAADICFTPDAPVDERLLVAQLRSALAGRPVDVVVQPLAHRRKRLLVADMDSTMIGQECVDELADKVGLKSRIAAITERAMNGDIAFEPALRERIGLLRGLPLTIIIVAAGRIDGVEEPILGRDAKHAALLDLRRKLGLARDQTLAVGDGANDLAMLEAAGLGVAYRARPKVAASARARIDHGDLTALLYIQGYRREEFATG